MGKINTEIFWCIRERHGNKELSSLEVNNSTNYAGMV
jgi:hypothetical protein